MGALVKVYKEPGGLVVGPQYIVNGRDFTEESELVDPTEEERDVDVGDGDVRRIPVLIRESGGLEFYYARLEDVT